MLMMTVKCTGCFQELAGGPPSDVTATYLQGVASAHQCAEGFAGNMAQLAAQEHAVGQMSKEEIDRLVDAARTAPPSIAGDER